MRGKPNDIIQKRITIVFVAGFLVFAALLGRLFILQIVEHDTYVALAKTQQYAREYTAPERGMIFARDKNGILFPLALRTDEKNLIAIPRRIDDPEKIADFLSGEFNYDKNPLLQKLSKKDDPYEIVEKDIDERAAEKINAAGFEGLVFETAEGRWYPQDTLAAHVLGFARKEDGVYAGQYGVERMYDFYLGGGGGFFENVGSASGNFFVALGRRIAFPSRAGGDIVLTIDPNIQSKAEEILEGIETRWGMEAGSVLVMDPKTGRILALAARPVFNPNEFFTEEDFSVFLNPLVEARYELGSVMKPLTMAAALEEGVVKPETTYYDAGEVSIGNYTIRNFDGKAYHTQTMSEVLEKSLNTGMVHVARLLGQEKHLKYLKAFQLDKRTGIDLPGEVAGVLSHLESRRPIDFATASFGQGIAVTPIRFVTAFGALAHDGKMMRPYIVEKKIDSSGNESVTEPEVVARVLSPETAEAITKMLVSVVRNGFEYHADVDGYFIAGKTGTAQIPKSDARGYSDDVIHTFIGYGPAFNPKFLIYFQINKPEGNRFAANTLSPAFHDLAEYILNYYEIPPDEK